MRRPPPALQVLALDLDHRARVARHLHEAAVLRHGAHHVHVADLVLCRVDRVALLILLLVVVVNQELLINFFDLDV